MKVIKQMAQELWRVGKISRRQAEHLIKEGFAEESDFPGLDRSTHLFEVRPDDPRGLYHWGEYGTPQGAADAARSHSAYYKHSKWHLVDPEYNLLAVMDPTHNHNIRPVARAPQDHEVSVAKANRPNYFRARYAL